MLLSLYCIYSTLWVSLGEILQAYSGWLYGPHSGSNYCVLAIIQCDLMRVHPCGQCAAHLSPIAHQKLTAHDNPSCPFETTLAVEISVSPNCRRGAKAPNATSWPLDTKTVD